MNPRQAKAIAARVTDDLDLHPPLSSVVVMRIVAPDPLADSSLPPLRHYPEELHAPIESRILQEAEDE